MIELKKENNEICDGLEQPRRYLLEFAKETKQLTPSEVTSSEGVRVAQRLHAEVESRFGVLPNFFRLAPESPEITANLWDFARFAYLDNPLPSLFKERLFVYLSRFCEVHYCVVRHVGFLVGLGRPSGDEHSPVLTIEEVLRLLRRTLPRGLQAEAHIARCTAPDAPLAALPSSDSDMEEAMFTCVAHAFLQTVDAPRCLIALKRALGEVRFQHLIVFLGFVRTAHYWTKVHTELVLEEDIKELLATQEVLAECLLNDSEAGTSEISRELMDELASLRESKKQHDELLRAHQVARESEERLRHRNAELAERVAELQTASSELQASRRAALNLMEEALQARQLAETLNAELRKENSRRKQAEEALRQNQAQLENRVAERTTELQQVNAALSRDMEERKKLEEQLLQSQKMESIGVLAGGIAHDFNNVLNIIQGYAYILRGHETQDKETSESLTVIDETVHRGSALVQQLLTLARKSPTKVESVNVNALVQGLITLITQTFPKTIELIPILEADLPAITGDKNQIEQALLNLCVNARDAMSDGGRLSFKTQSIEGATLQGLGKTLDGRYVCLEVSDTGVGMDESTRKRIFEPFFTTKNMDQGTGLGLSVVYGIVKNHNGFINVESKPESGTSFRLYFPVAQSLAKPATDEIAEVSCETTERPNGHGTILLVEDEKNMLELLEKTLARHGYQVLAAADGETALNIYRRSKEAIDVVMLDMGLPKLAGQDVLLKIRNENPDVKVVIASGYLEPKLQSVINRAGVKYFLSKPYRPDEVVRTLQSLIERES